MFFVQFGWTFVLQKVLSAIVTVFLEWVICGNFCQTWDTETIIHQISMLSSKLNAHSSVHVFLILVKISSLLCIRHKKANMACIEIFVHSITTKMSHIYENYLGQVEMIIPIVMCPYEYDHVFIILHLILIILQDKFLPVERNLQFCTLLH